MNYTNTAAEAAKLIRAELKKSFPGIKFSVRSSTFAGGNAIDIHYMNGVPSEQVEKITDRYQAGDFNGMEDIYEYRSNPEELPTAKYIMVHREVDQVIKNAVKLEIAKAYGITDATDEGQWRSATGQWSDQKVWKELEVNTY